MAAVPTFRRVRVVNTPLSVPEHMLFAVRRHPDLPPIALASEAF
ncbi:hypothetical protein [Micromonospora costi]|nr:hypothetical protein [Micromonospora costi]